MSTHLRISAAALIAGCVLAGCSNTTSGTAMMPTQSKMTDAPRSTIPRATIPRTTSKAPSSAPRTPGAQPPGDALTMTCKDYLTLDPDAQTAVVEEVLAQEGSVLGPQNTDLAKTLADAVCQLLPTSTVSEILLGAPPG